MKPGVGMSLVLTPNRNWSWHYSFGLVLTKKIIKLIWSSLNQNFYFSFFFLQNPTKMLLFLCLKIHKWANFMQREVIWSWTWKKISYGLRNLTLGLNILLKIAQSVWFFHYKNQNQIKLVWFDFWLFQFNFVFRFSTLNAHPQLKQIKIGSIDKRGGHETQHKRSCITC